MLKDSSLRVYLTGQVCAQRGQQILRENQFSSRQARLLFAYLLCQQSQAVTKEQLAEVLWPGEIPAAWDSALKSLVSKLRRPLATLDLSIAAQFGCYQLSLPTGSWVDLEVASTCVDEAEGALRAGGVNQSWGPTNVALTIAKRPFLPGEDGEWVAQKRRDLRDCLVRALDCYVQICLATNQTSLAAQMAAQTVSLEPFRETGYQQLMRSHAALGNRAEALRVYQKCRELLAEELGVDPSPETEALYLELLVQ